MASGDNPNSRANLIMYQKGVAQNPNGKKPGTLNRSTIARKVLEAMANYPEEVFAKLQKQYPGLEKSMTVGEMMMWIQAHKAITKQDTNAFSAVMESGYGKPTQEIRHDLAERETIALPPITFLKKAQ